MKRYKDAIVFRPKINEKRTFSGGDMFLVDADVDSKFEGHEKLSKSQLVNNTSILREGFTNGCYGVGIKEFKVNTHVESVCKSGKLDKIHSEPDSTWFIPEYMCHGQDET